MSAKWLIPALTYLCFVRSQSPCTTPDGKSGDCKRIDLCDSLYRLVRPSVLVQDEELNLLRKSTCGYDQAAGKTKVCCPIVQTSCFTPEDQRGQCIDILNCDHIITRLRSPPVPQQYKDYVNSLRCQGPATYSVCCGPPPAPVLVPTDLTTLLPTPIPTTLPTPIEHTNENVIDPAAASTTNVGCTLSSQPPDPASKCCGLDGFSPKIFGGEDAAIDQYPWLALIEYQSAGKIKLMCGGVLISGRYVLTAGHCVKGYVLTRAQPINVRLGEYDTTNSANVGKDCVELEGGDEGEVECTADPVIIPIERIIPHPEYNPQNLLRRNDIALLRLASIPTYTDFVRPICLPAADITTNFPETEWLYAAGWGAVSDKISQASIKQHVKLPYKTKEVCQQAYTKPGRIVTLWDRQGCAGGETGKDSCKGDSGGPLMYNNGNYTELIGIVSFGTTPCGLENSPGVYTKVFEYISWIRSNIEP